MKRLIASLFLVMLCTNAFACENQTALCELLRQVESGPNVQALERVETLAKAGDLQAQLALGAIYGTGKGAPHDDAKALAWFLLAARAGDPTAQSIVGNFYAAGRAGPINLPEARRWYEFAASAGDHDAQRMLGIIYARGEGAPLDYSAAYIWFALASRGGDVDALKYKDLVRAHISQSDLVALEEKVKAWKPIRSTLP